MKFKIGDKVRVKDPSLKYVLNNGYNLSIPMQKQIGNVCKISFISEDGYYGLEEDTDISYWSEECFDLVEDNSNNTNAIETKEVGIKKDDGKVKMDLIPVRFLEEVGKVLTFGAKKYDPYNWSKGIKFSRLFAALMRHSYAFWKGEDRDPETGYSHLAHAACCLAFMFELKLIDSSNDDRPKIYISMEKQHDN